MKLGEFVAMAKSTSLRRYSVSSSPSLDPEKVTVTVGQVRFTTGTGRLWRLEEMPMDRQTDR